jgi:hypothetical protein
MNVPRTSTRLVYLKLTRPYTVHELDCAKIDRMFTKRDRVNPDHYVQVPISEVPSGKPRCKICTPGVI